MLENNLAKCLKDLKSSDQREDVTMRTLTFTPPLSPRFNLLEQQKIEEAIQIRDPMLFRVSKQNKHFFLFGSEHIFALNAFSPEIRKILIGCDKLILERFHMDEPIHELENFIIGNAKQIFRTPTDSNHFGALGAREKELITTHLKPLQKVLTTYFDKNLSDLKDAVIFGAYVGVCTELNHGHCVTESQLKFHYLQQQKCIMGLETSADLLEQILEFNDLLNNNFDKKIVKYAKKQKNFNAMELAYIDGTYLKNTSFIDSPAVANRNGKWFPVLSEEFVKNQNFLVCVGSLHLLCPTNGLLEWLEHSGFSLEKCDNQGNFTPFSWLHRNIGCHHSLESVKPLRLLFAINLIILQKNPNLR